MHIIIIGGGRVGYELARNLAKRKQDVTIIEINENIANNISSSLLIEVIRGNGATFLALEKAGIKHADMLIAVTNLDEVNTVACMVAKKYFVPLTVCRIRESGYVTKTLGLNPEHFGIDVLINPEYVAAAEILKMLQFPAAGEIEYFARGKIMMLGLTVGEDPNVNNVSLHQLLQNTENIIAGICKPNGKLTIPGGNEIIEPHSKLYLLGKSNPLNEISTLLHQKETKINQVTIFGGGAIGLQTALMLEECKESFSVKLIEKAKKRCEELSVKLKKSLIINGDATEIAMFREEDMSTTDAVVVATSEDRTNIVAALLARQFGVRKIICEVKKPQYVEVYNTLGIKNLINPRLLAAVQIIRLTQRKEIVAMSILQDEAAEVFELILPETAKVANKKIGDVHFPHGMIIGSIMRGEEIIIPNKSTELLPEDHLVIFSIAKIIPNLDYYFAPAA
jgi:trk system potassium uptake protein